MKIITSTLTNPQIHEIIDYIVSFFLENKKKKVVICYGWSCKTENLYQDIKVNIDDLKVFLEKSQKMGVYDLGKSDFYISDIKETFEFLLCHESDVHFSSKDENLINRIEKDWKTKYKIYKQIGAKWEQLKSY